MGKEDEEEYEIMRGTQFEEDNLIKQITFDNLRKKNNHIRLLLSKIQQQVVDNFALAIIFTTFLIIT